ncbi:MAG: flagellar protein FlgN [Candidatus Eisenbacteria bacterium]|uniref:Flagellar protein FlgN n=1 Tax=Eiseniibacteriota bacterium TaxID=2212470 RepID=A0A948S0G9_UNCEI|nr:flagellar protein FlgN [Candidatus Eisenbacteria bacterium]MBU1949312.1 flagellar protein FlgN [Candidatus Eisenbacteria bacterium]MBU2692939.1 flagellar protein FlgN [Candidatus Eisenbacteria bacterium]
MIPTDRVRRLISILQTEIGQLKTFLIYAGNVQDALVAGKSEGLIKALDQQVGCLDELKVWEQKRRDVVVELTAHFKIPSANSSLSDLLPHLDHQAREELQNLGETCRTMAQQLGKIQRVNALLAEKSLVCVEGLGRTLIDAVLNPPEYGPSGHRPDAKTPPSILDRRA